MCIILECALLNENYTTFIISILLKILLFSKKFKFLRKCLRYIFQNVFHN